VRVVWDTYGYGILRKVSREARDEGRQGSCHEGQGRPGAARDDGALHRLRHEDVQDSGQEEISCLRDTLANAYQFLILTGSFLLAETRLY